MTSTQLTLIGKYFNLWDITKLVQGYSQVTILVDMQYSTKYVKTMESLGYSAMVLSSQTIFSK